MKRYLVTGGAGFIGSKISEKLIENGDFVRILDDESRGSKLSIPKSNNLEFVHGDIRNIKDVENACQNIDSIIHLAFVNGTKYFYEKPDVVLEVGAKGMLNVLDAAKKYKVKELFLASSSEVYQTPPIIPTPEGVPYLIPDVFNPRYSYAGGKIISEMLSIYIGKTIFEKVVIFRPHNVYGPNMGTEHVIPELISKIIPNLNSLDKPVDLPIQGDGSSSRSFIYIDDFVDGIMLLLKKGKNQQIYNIGTTEEISVKQLAEKIASVANISINLITTSSPKGSVSRRCPDITKISNLGFAPKTTLRDGLQKTFSWYKIHK